MAGRGLGSLTLSLVIQMAGFTAGLDKAGRQLDAKTRAMQKRMYEFGRQIGTAMKVGFGLAAAGLAIYVKNTIEAEKVQAQLTSRIKDTAGAAGRSLQQLNAQAQKLQSLTVFDDETIGQAQATLMVFTEIKGLNFDRAIESATDLATVTGKDLTVATQILGKALNDPIKGLGALGKAGVQLDESLKTTIKNLVETGRVAEAQTLILDELEGRMGTAAEAARNTLGGALEGLKNAFNNLLEGDGGDDGVIGATQAINDFSDSLNSPEAHANMEALIGGLVSAAQFVGELAGAFIKAAQQIGNAMGFISNSAEDFIAMNKATLSGDFGGFLEQRRKLLGEYQKFNEETKRTRGDFDNRWAGVVATSTTTNLRSAGTITLDPMNVFAPKKTGGGHSGASKAEAEAHRAAADAARRHAEAEDQLREAIEKTEQASADFSHQLEDLVAAQGGPLAEAQLAYNRQLADLKKLAQEGEVSTTDLAQAEELLGVAYAKTTAEIRERLDTGGQALKQMQQELDLLNMQTDAERVRAQFLIDHPTATGADADAAVRLDAQIKETREAISAMDEFRSSFEDFVVAAANGKASFKDFADMVIQQIIRIGAAKLTASLFGEQGTSGGGLFGAFFSFLSSSGSSSYAGGGIGIGGGTTGGYATGTDYAPGGMAWVGEHGPELVNLPRGSSVTPADKVRGAPSITIHLNGDTNRDTAQQIANAVKRQLIFSARS